MKFATWNINECVGITCNLENQKTVESVNIKNIEEIIEKINKYNFDIICFQEYPVYINGKETLTQEILNKTNLKYYETYDTYDSYLFKGGRVGIAIFSKYKIKEKYKTLFINPNMKKISSSGIVYYSYDKPIIKAVVSIKNEEYTIITGHAIAFKPFDKTEFDFPESYKPLENLIMDCNDKNIIVVGDFNTEKINKVMPNLNNKVKDIINMPTTKSYYEGRGEIQMDYILINDNLTDSKKYKLDNFSDHYIIAADISTK